jgi:hypothetical protein
MAVYSVHLPGAPGQKPNAAEAAFVREGFCWPAYVFGPFWLLARRLWLAAALWCFAFLIISSLAGAGLLSSTASLMLMVLMQIFIGFEANRLIERQLWRQGYDLAEIIAAPHLEEAEMAFYRRLGAEDEAAARGLAPALSGPNRPPPPPPPSGPAPVIGSFPAPEA